MTLPFGPPPAEIVAAAMHAAKYRVFTTPRSLNLILLRRVPGTVDLFDDILIGMTVSASTGKWAMRPWRVTADPGRPSIEHPTRRDGTAQVAAGQHLAAYVRGYHHPGTPGQYECLVPARPIPVVRYLSAADFAAGRGTPSTSSSTQIHHASATHESTTVGPWSEGCIVHAAHETLDEMLWLCHDQERAGLGPTFSITVLPWSP